jgi:hypothetical protein
MLPPTEEEDTAQVIRLYAQDSDNDKYQAIITMGLHELAEDGTPLFEDRAGALYQYDEQILVSRAEAQNLGVRITAADTTVTDPDNRVIYWPNLHTNSHADFGKTPELLVKPCFNYKVVETETAEKFESDVARIPIDVRPVNDAPFVYGDTDPNYIYSWAPIPSDICFENCQFQEDFGQRYPWDAEFEYIYMGGGDIEKDMIDFVITSLECDDAAVLENDLQGVKIAVGSVIELNQPGELVPALRFRPGPDANDGNGGFNTHYCKFSYKVRDSQGAESAKVHTVTINVSPMDDPVRLATEDQLVVALEEEPKAFVIDAVDPENKQFDTVIQACKFENKGKFAACRDAACANVEEIDCANIPAGGIVLAHSKKRQQSSGYGFTFLFTSGKINSLTEGLGYQYLQVAFSEGGNVGDSFLVNVNVVSLNEAPVLSMNDAPAKPVTSVQVETGSVFSPSLIASDVDLNQGDMTVMIEFSPRDGASMMLDSTVIDQNKVDLWDLSGSVQFSGKLAQVNKVFESFQFQGKDAIKSEYTITVTINDNGFTGQCGSRADIDTNSLKWDGTLCPLEASHVIKVNYVDTAAINASIIAGAGAGVLGLTALAAVAAAKFFNKEAANGDYAPWDAFEGDEPSVSNPLYESATIGGSSSIYQDANSNYVEMGSGGGSYL